MLILAAAMLAAMSASVSLVSDKVRSGCAFTRKPGKREDQARSAYRLCASGGW